MRTRLFFLLPFLSLVCLSVGGVALNSLQQGIVSDVLLFTSFTLLMIWVALYHSKLGWLLRRKGAKNRAMMMGSILLVTVIVIGLGMLSNRPRFNKSVDITRDGTNTLSPQSEKVIAKINEHGEPVEVLAFLQSEETKDRFRSLFSLYTSKDLQANMKFVDPNAEPTQAMKHDITVANTIVFKLGNKESRITAVSEEKVTNAMMKLLREGDKTIVFISGHGEADPRGQEAEGLEIVVGDLENNNYVVETVSLLETGKMPQADVVVIAGPQYDFTSAETKILEAYVEQGGALLGLVGALKPVPNLAAFFAKVGITLNNDLILLNPEDPRAQLLGQNNAIVSEFDAYHSLTKDFAKGSGVAMVMSTSRSLTVSKVNQFNLSPLEVAKTSESMVSIKGVASEKDLESANEADLVAGPFTVVAVASGLTKGSELAKSDKKELKKADIEPLQAAAARPMNVIVAGSSDFATNLGVQRAENFDMFMNMISFLVKDEDFISIRPKEKTASSLDMASDASHFNLLLVSFVYPFIFLGTGFLLWFRRRSA